VEVIVGDRVEVPREWLESVVKYTDNVDRFLRRVRVFVPVAAAFGVVLGLIVGWLLWGMP
jgi:uncharacterized protein YacL